MYPKTRFNSIIRAISLVTLALIMPSSVQAWYFMPERVFSDAEYAQGKVQFLTDEQLTALGNASGVNTPIEDESVPVDLAKLSTTQADAASNIYDLQLVKLDTESTAPFFPPIEPSGLTKLDIEAIFVPKEEKTKDSFQVAEVIVVTGESDSSSASPTERTRRELLNQGRSDIGRGNTADGAADLFELIARFPDSGEARKAEETLHDLAYAAKRGEVPHEQIEEFITWADREGSQEGSVQVANWAIVAKRLGSRSARRNNNTARAEALDLDVIDEAKALISRAPQDIRQLSVARILIEAGKDLGREKHREVAMFLKDLTLGNSEKDAVNAAARLELLTYYARDEFNRPEAILQAFEILEDFEQGSYDFYLTDNSLSGELRGQLEFVHGYANYQMGYYDRALTSFEKILHECRNSSEVRDRAVHYAAVSEYHLARYDQQERVDLISRYLNAYPDSQYNDALLWLLGNTYEAAGEHSWATETYMELENRYPESNFREASTNRRAFVSQYLHELDQYLEHRAKHLAQSTSMMCGPIALNHLLNGLGIASSVGEIAQEAGTSAQGTSLSSLIEVARSKSVSMEGIIAGAPESLPLPWIALMGGQHVVCVSAQSEDKLLVKEEFTGRGQWLSLDDFMGQWNGIALIVNDDTALEDLALDLESLDEILVGTGQTDDFPSDVDDNYINCPNQDNECDECDKCCDEGGDGNGPGNGPGGGPPPSISPNRMACIMAPCGDPPPNVPPGSGGNGSGGDSCPAPPAGPPGKPAPPELPGSPPSLNPSTLITLASNTNTVHGTYQPRQNALQLNESDISFPVKGGMSIVFKRHWFNAWGGYRGYYSQTYDKPYRNNLGVTWTHNLNQHLRVSSLGNKVIYIDATGNSRTFTKTSTSGGYDIFTPKTSLKVAAAKSWELKRDTTTEEYTLKFPAGATLNFSAEIDTDERYCRLEKVEDDFGNAIDYTYDDNKDAPFGRLTKVASNNTSDSRYLKLEHNSTGYITKVSMKENTTTLRYVEYEGYDPWVGSANYLTKVKINGESSQVTEYDYDWWDNGTDYRVFMNTITDQKGNVTDFDFDYATMSNKIHATKVTINYENDLKTVISKTSTEVIRVQNFDGTTALDKYQVVYDGSDSKISNMRFYHGPSSNDSDLWSYTYSSDDQLTNITGPGGTWNSFAYTAKGRYDYAGPNTNRRGTFNYNDAANDVFPESYTAPDGVKTYYYYDDYDRLTRVAHPSTSASNPPGASDGAVYAYDSEGFITKYTDNAGEEWIYEYDSMGYLVTKILPTDNPSTPTHPITYEHNDFGMVTKQTDTLGRSTTYEYAGTGCTSCGSGSALVLTKVIDHDSNATEYEYDDNGNMITMTNFLNEETIYEYDSMNKMTKVTYDNGQYATYEYDIRLKLTKATSTAGDEVTYAHDHMGRVTKVTNAIGSIEQYYNGRGLMTKVKDAEGGETTYEYNSYNDLIKTTDPEGKTMHMFYDEHGRMTKKGADSSISPVDPIEYFFSDTTGIMTRVKYTNGAVTTEATYKYDLTGKLTQIDDWMGGAGNDGHFFEYDELGRVTTYRDFDDDPSGTRKKLDYVYDDGGRIITMTDYEGNDTTYTYTESGQMSTITAPGSKTWDFDYNNLGQRTMVTLPNGMESLYSYDSDHRMTKIDHTDGAGTPATLQGWDYALGDDGNILRQGDLTNKQAWYYGYDGGNRLTQARMHNAAGRPSLAIDYQYDKNGNMLYKDQTSYTTVLADTFDDGNFTGWTGNTANFTVSNGVLENILDTGASRYLERTNTETTYELNFSYVNKDTDPSSNRMIAYLLYNGSDYLFANFYGDKMTIGEKVSGVYTELDADTNASSVEDTWYDVRIVVDAATESIVVYRGVQGQELTEILSVSGYTISPGSNKLRLLATAGATYGFDNVVVSQERQPDSITSDDFADGDYTSSPAWTVGGTWSASSNYMENTVHVTNWQNFNQSESHDDFDLYFDYNLTYTGDPATNTDKRLQMHFRKDNTSGEMLFLDMRPDKFQLYKYVSSTYTELDVDTDADSVSGTTYSVWVHARGSHVEVWRGEQGEPMELVVETDASVRTSGDKIQFNVPPNADVEVDNIAMAEVLDGQSFSDDFTDGDYTSDPAWTVTSGSWSVSSGVLENAYNASSTSTIKRDITGDSVTTNFSYSYYDASVSGYGATVILNDTDTENLDVAVVFDTDSVDIKSYDGSSWTVEATAAIGITVDDWYDAQVVKDGDHIEVWWGDKDTTLTKTVSADLDGYYGMDLMQFYIPAGSTVGLDNINVTLPETSHVANEYDADSHLVRSNADGVSATFTYDEWCRVTTKTIGSNNAVYEYRYGSQLKSIDTSIPGEIDVSYIYDAMNQIRFEQIDPDGASEITWSRWNAKGAKIAEYKDDSANFWDVGDADMARIIDTSFGHETVLATTDFDINDDHTNHNYHSRSFTGQEYASFNSTQTATGYGARAPDSRSTRESGNDDGEDDGGIGNCANAAPASQNSGICDRYDGTETHKTFNAKCVCENAGDSDWDKDVRGCLACAYDKGVDGDVAHEQCYAAATKRRGIAAKAKAVADIAATLSYKCWFCPNAIKAKDRVDDFIDWLYEDIGDIIIL